MVVATGGLVASGLVEAKIAKNRENCIAKSGSVRSGHPDLGAAHGFHDRT